MVDGPQLTASSQQPTVDCRLSTIDRGLIAAACWLIRCPLASHDNYRMFSVCSLIFSKSSFMFTTCRCMLASLAFDPMVLISRPIS